MGWLFQRKTATGIEQAKSTLSPFIAAALNDIGVQALRDQVRTRTLAECYIYGAIRYLASYDDMRADSSAELLESMLVSHFDADSDEVSSCRMFLTRVPDGGKEHLFMVEGASALRRWLVNGDRTVGSELKSLLDLSA